MNCSTTLAKMFLFVFNILFFLLGCACLGIGIWIAVSKNSLFSMVNLATKDVSAGDKTAINNYLNETPLVQSAAYVLIAIGVFTFVVGFCGCCGAIKESKCLLTIYAVLVSFIVIIEIAVAIMAGVFKSKITDHAGTVFVNLQDKYFVSFLNISSYEGRVESQITAMINYAQVTFSCCGMKNPRDIKDSPAWVNSTRTYMNSTMQIPLTCCALKSEKKESLLKNAEWKSMFTTPKDYLVDESCPLTVNKGFDQTCFKKIEEFIGHYSVPLIAIGICVALFELLIVMLACCLIRSLDQKLG